MIWPSLKLLITKWDENLFSHRNMLGLSRSHWRWRNALVPLHLLMTKHSGIKSLKKLQVRLWSSMHVMENTSSLLFSSCHLELVISENNQSFGLLFWQITSYKSTIFQILTKEIWPQKDFIFKSLYCIIFSIASPICGKR